MSLLTWTPAWVPPGFEREVMDFPEIVKTGEGFEHVMRSAPMDIWHPGVTDALAVAEVGE